MTPILTHVIIPTAIVSAWKHYHQGNVQWLTAWSLAPTALVGGVIGAWLTTQISSGNLKRLFGGFLAFVGLRLLIAKQLHKAGGVFQRFE